MVTLRKASLGAVGFVVCTVGLVGSGCSSQPAATEESGQSADDVTTSDIVARAEQWSSAKLL